jgi:hypothetical protein
MSILDGASDFRRRGGRNGRAHGGWCLSDVMPCPRHVFLSFVGGIFVVQPTPARAYNKLPLVIVKERWRRYAALTGQHLTETNVAPCQEIVRQVSNDSGNAFTAQVRTRS